MATGVVGFSPESQGIQFTARPALRTRDAIGPRSLSRASGSSLASNSGLFPGGDGGELSRLSTQKLTSIEVEAALRGKVQKKFESLKQAFRIYDVDENETVTKGEFRRVLETYCMPLTSEQFDSIVAKLRSAHGGTTIKYLDFLTKFSGYDAGNKNRDSRSSQSDPKEINMDMIEKLLRDKINTNLRSVVKGLQLLDFNMDGKIQRHELRRVLENCCFRFTDQQFEKLWQRYDYHHTGLINYRDFLQKLGINVKNGNTGPPSNTVAGVLKWPKVTTPHKGASEQLRSQQKEDEKLIRSLTFDQIEIEFRNRMRSNYAKLKKAFMTFDKHLDGYVSIEDLKSILNSFTIPMNDQLFVQLMDRCGIKASGRVSWEIFLEKFQNPITVGNGQSLPIRPNYKIHPIMETQKVVDWDTIWNQLYKRVQSHYNSFKEAFLQMDKNRDGKVTRKEFRELVEKFTFRLDDKQFKALMSRIDPEHTNSIDYHTFLRLFEEKETKEGHKWLKSVHRYNSKPKTAILAWETVEDLLREKITYYWKDVSDWLTYHDRRGQGYLSKSTLKKILDMQVLPISDDHFENLISRCTNFKDGKVSYMEFLNQLGVDVSPGDVAGLSTQITDGSKNAEILRNIDLMNRHDQMALSQCYRTSQMSADEVISRFKDKMAQWSPALRKVFTSCDKQNKGHISKKEFRMILSDLGILMSDEQFSELMLKLNMHNGHMNYMDFILNFGDPRHPDSSPGVVEHLKNHRVNPIRGDEYGMSVTEVEAKLRQKLRENFTNLREAFYKFDDLHRGCLDKSSFRRMLDSFMIITSDAEYEKLCQRLGIGKDSRISYVEFLERFELTDKPEGHKWLNSVHRFNETLVPKPFSATEAHKVLAQKVFRQWNDLSKAFRSIDSKGNGIITKQELRETLNKFVMPMQKEEFKNLWKRLDTDMKGYISHQDFLEKLGTAEFATADNGPSSNIISGNRQYMEDHQRQQQEKHENITWNQANLTMNMPAVIVERQLRDKIRDSYSDFFSAFRKYDTQKCGSLSANDIQRVLNDQHFFISDEQFFALLNRIGLTTSQSRINYADFLNAFEDGRKSSYGQQPQDIKIEEYRKLSPEQAEKRLKQKLQANIDDVTKAFAAFDKDSYGKISVEDFHRILDLFCFVMTKPQWKHIKAGLPIGPDQCVSYNTFLSAFASNDADINDQYLQSLQATFPLSSSPLIKSDEVVRRIHEAVVSHYHNILRDFESTDFAKIGSVTQEDLREVIARNIMRLNDEQFNRLCEISPVNEYGNVDYKEFMRLFFEGMPNTTDPNQLPPIKSTNQKFNFDQNRPSTSMSQRPYSRASNRPFSRLTRSVSSRSGFRSATPLVNAESAEFQIKDVVFRNWHEMQKRCREMDISNSGSISVDQFENLLGQYGVYLDPQEFSNLVTKYDLNENGRFCYSDFIRHFLLTVKSTGSKVMSNREKMPARQLHKQNSAIEEEGDSDDVIRRTRECIGQNWKKMRREFQNVDTKNQGTVSSDEFRRVLKQFNINVSEMEFQQLQEKYEKDYELVNYNDFLKDHLI